MDKYYKVLGLNNGANEADIKKAYKKKALQHHPDKNKNSKESQEKFKEISEAYEILTNKREGPQRQLHRHYHTHVFHRPHPFHQQHPFHVFFGSPSGNQLRTPQGATLVEKKVVMEGDLRKEIVTKTQNGVENIQETIVNTKTGETKIRVTTRTIPNA